MRDNKQLHTAKKNQKDCFFTKRETVEKELIYYKKFLKGKTVYCNCDDPHYSQFWAYLKENFYRFGIKELIATYYSEDEPVYKTTIKKDSLGRLHTSRKQLAGNGSFDSEECLAILQQADVVITNPPFSRLKDFVPLMYQYKKKFLVLGNQNMITFQNVYPYLLEKKLYLGVSIHSGGTEFVIPDNYTLSGNYSRLDTETGIKYAEVTGVRWFTNMDHHQYPAEMKLHTAKYNISHNAALTSKLMENYDAQTYPKYDNCNAIEVPITECIPSDYKGIIGVPITFLDKYNPQQFRIVGFRKGDDGRDLTIKGKAPYFRVLIERIRN